jgi:hypothetical protein
VYFLISEGFLSIAQHRRTLFACARLPVRLPHRQARTSASHGLWPQPGLPCLRLIMHDDLESEAASPVNESATLAAVTTKTELCRVTTVIVTAVTAGSALSCSG